MKNQIIKLLILGSGGREFQFASAFSDQGYQVYVAQGNDWMPIMPNVELVPFKPIPENFGKIVNFAIENGIALILVGPEAPLCAGFVDFVNSHDGCQDAGIKVIGPTAAAAMLEQSKSWAKGFMNRHGIPTARSFTVDSTNLEDGKKFLCTLPGPWVIKANGLAEGKGVIVCHKLQEATDTMIQMAAGNICGEAGKTVVIEEFLDGREVSFFSITDDSGYVIMPEARDYKNLLPGNQGPNTGGMGAISPVVYFTKEIREKVEQRILIPTIDGMKEEGKPYKGFIFIGLMIVNGDPYVIEYNCRMGDPETISVIDRIFDQFPQLIIAASENQLNNFELKPAPYTSVAIVLASAGYASKEGPILNKEIFVDESVFAHNCRNIVGAGVKMIDGKYFTSGGRVCTVVCRGGSFETAKNKVMRLVDEVDFEGMQFRHDIGDDVFFGQIPLNLNNNN